MNHCYDCEMPRCKKCGRHYDLFAAEGKEVCDACQINLYSEECEAATKAFNGNYEVAALFYGW